MKQYLAGKIRNIALAGHSASGKTSLVEALLFLGGETDRLGKVADGNTVSDFDPEEIKRRTSVSSAIAPFAWGSCKINLVDSPGLFDFAGGVSEAVRAVESVLIVVSARSGVEVGTEKAYKMALDKSKAKMFFISQTDVENADFYKVLEDLKARFGPSVCPLIVPHMVDGKVACYINLIDQKAYKYAAGKPSEVAMPETGHRLEGLIAAMSEAIAETDEELFEKFFSGEQFTRDDIIKGLHKGALAGAISPVLCGSSIALEGLDMLLDAMVDLMPSAWEKGGELGYDQDDNPIEVACTDEAPFSGIVFKTVADPFVGKLNFIKVVSGKLSADMQPLNTRTGSNERLGKIIYVRGKKQEDTAYITAGDIGAVTKLSETKTGDTLCDPKKFVRYEEVSFAQATISMAIKPKAKGDEGKIAGSLLRLIEEDPTAAYYQNAETHQQIISGLGEQHLDVMVSKLKSKFGVDVELTEPRVPYRETVRKKVKVEGRHKKQSGGHGQFGHVWIEFEPCESDELVFAEEVFGGSVPKSFFPAVEKGLQECVKHGPMAGYPVVGLKATLVDGSYHPVDSSEMSFKMAATLAYKAGLSQASPVILEPIGTLKVYVPDTNTGDIIGELNKKRGRVLGMGPDPSGLQLVEAEVPMREMHDFTTLVRSITQGRGWFDFKFERYEQLPTMLEAEVIEEAKQIEEE